VFGSSHKGELGASRLARMLGLDIVPLTESREVQGQTGSFQLLVEGITKVSPESSEHYPPEALLFDKLIGNSDRSNDNLGSRTLSSGKKQPVLFDNAAALTTATFVPNADDEGKIRASNGSLKERVKLLQPESLNDLGIGASEKVKLVERLSTIKDIVG
jgi:hypothetical protein